MVSHSIGNDIEAILRTMKSSDINEEDGGICHNIEASNDHN